jgi:fluoride exporter
MPFAKRDLDNIFLIGAGGFLGGICRFLLCEFVEAKLGTLSLNLLGSIVLALLTFSSEQAPIVYFVNIGIIGSFTTFSSFAYETFKLLEEGKNLSFFLNIFLNISFCNVAVEQKRLLEKLQNT